MITTRILESLTELQSLAPEWSALLERSGANDFSVSPTWLLPWWQVYGSAEGRRLCAAAFYRDDRLIGLAPLLRRRKWHRGVLPMMRIEPLASGEREQEETCSVYLGPIAERGAEEQVADALMHALQVDRFGEWDEFVLPYMRRENPLRDLLAARLRRAGLVVTAREGRECPHVPLRHSFDAYLEDLSPKRRYNVRRSLRDLEKWAGGKLELKLVTNVDQLELGKKILMNLHGHRWHGEGKAGAFDSVRFLAFHDRLMLPMLKAKMLELMWLEARGEPVAALYTIVWGNRVYAYQMGRRTNLPKGLRPGIAIHALAIRRAIELGRLDYDFGSGNSRYKSDLATAVRPLVELRAARPSWLESTKQLFDQAEDRARLMKRRWVMPRPAPVVAPTT